MKQDLDDPNPQMWDLFAYRILKPEDSIHHRTGSAWKIDPTYDFAHCLCDSFEGITHSLCTTKFEMSRQSYEWLCKRLDVYTPMQREYGRLNVANTVLSKRKIQALVAGGHVRGWDDPRLYTLIALRRRGIPPGAIMSFVNEVGVSKADTNIEVHRFEQSVRKYLETTVPRLMLVLDPLPITIENIADDHFEMVELPFGKDPARGTVFIDSSDFREVDSNDYFRLALGKTIGLMKVPYPITATSYEKDPTTGRILHVKARYEIPTDGEKPKRPKSYIHWVGQSTSHNSPIKAEVRIFNLLFRSTNPSANPAGFISDLHEHSEEIYTNTMLDKGFREFKSRAPWPKHEAESVSDDQDVRPESVRFQVMRVAYFCVEKDSLENRLVLNRIVGLKDDTGKFA